MLVVDASVTFRLLAGTAPERRGAGARLSGEELVSPELMDVEVLAAIRNSLRRGELQPEDADAAVDELIRLPVYRLSHGGLSARAWSLRDNVTPYDAIYVAMAEVLDCALLTADKRLANATGPRCEIELIS